MARNPEGLVTGNREGIPDLQNAFDQRAFAASAAALMASHAMTDAVWQTYFAELPSKQLTLRTILVRIHGSALEGHPLNLSQARKMVIECFGVTLGTAIEWIDLLEGLGFIIRIQDAGTKKHEFLLVPSAEAKSGLFKVGQEYLVSLHLVVEQFREAIDKTGVDVTDLGWLTEVKAALDGDVQDYKTKSYRDHRVKPGIALRCRRMMRKITSKIRYR